MRNKRKKRKGTYALSKAPFRYSELLCNWQSAIMKGETDKARALGEQHSIKHVGLAQYRMVRKAIERSVHGHREAPA